MSSIATRTGDEGTTGLLYGQRVPKDHPQIEAVGTFDELNVALGAIKPHLGSADEALRVLLNTLQQNLIALMGEIVCAETEAARYAASNFTKITDADTTRIDDAIVILEARGLKYDGWATLGANARAATMETARVTARRAERRLVALPAHGRTVRPTLLRFTNRLADLLWLLAREAEHTAPYGAVNAKL